MQAGIGGFKYIGSEAPRKSMCYNFVDKICHEKQLEDMISRL